MQKNKSFYKKPLVVCLLATACCALWGSAFPSIKTGYMLFEIPSSDSFSQILFAGIRFFLAGLLTIIFGSALSKKILLPKKSSLPKTALLALFQTVLQYVFFYIGLAHTTGTKGSVLNSTSVFFAVIISSLIFRQERLNASKLAGCVIGFAGTVIINLSLGGFEADMSFLGEGFIILSSLSYAVSSVLIKRFSAFESPVVLSGYQFAIGGIAMAIFGIAFGGRLTVVTVKGILLLLYLAFVSAAAYTLWGVLLKHNEVSRVTVYGFMTPVFGCIMSAVFLKESASQSAVQTILSLVLVCIGIYLVNKKEKGVNYD